MKDEFTKKWITDNALEIIPRYEKGVLTLRALHYQLVSIGMTNSINHYKRVVNAMIEARWAGLVDFDTFSDLDRSMIGKTDFYPTDIESRLDEAKTQVRLWMTIYHKNRWENQDVYPEVFIEKKALQGVFSSVCQRWNVALGACKGYPSLTFLYEASLRIKDAVYEGKQPVILYFGDYDPSGEDIPRAIQENLEKLGAPEVEVRRIALMENQVIDWHLPPAPVKVGDSRSATWGGLGQVELDAVEPKKLQALCESAIEDVFDAGRYDDLMEAEESEKSEFIHRMKEFAVDL